MFSIASILVVLAAIFSFFNFRYLKLPTTVGVMLISLLASLGLVAAGEMAGGLRHYAADVVRGIDFHDALLHGMLAFLLFAGAFHVDLGDLRRHWVAISLMALVGTLLTAGAVGLGLFLVFGFLKIAVPLLGCLLFGALISPTDPVAVLAVMKAAGAPKDLETQVAGESLFNDGVGVVAFLALLAVANGEEPPTLAGAGMLLVRQAAGGAIVGLLAGALTYQLLKRVDQYQVELLLTLGLAMGSYALADELAMSAPIAAVVAGLVIGNQGRAYAMSARSKQRLDEFWELIDEVLNVILFMLVGLEMLVLPVRREFLAASAIAVVVSLLARWASVAAIVGSMRGLGTRFSPGAIRVLTWAGIRGGISLAMALALPPSDHAEILLAATYAVVIFSVVAQGLTIGPLIRRVARDLTIVFGGRIVKVLYRAASILLLLYFLGLGTGTWEFLHERQHAAEDAQMDAMARAMHLPVLPHHHDESNCEICAAIHMAFVSSGWVPLLVCLGLFVAFLTLLDTPLIPRMIPAWIDCRGPPAFSRAAVSK